MVNPGGPTSKEDRRQAEAAAGLIGQHILALDASSAREIDTAFATLIQRRAEALLATSDSFMLSQRERIALLAAAHAIRTMYFEREFVAVGGLMSYGAPLRQSYHQAGIYAGRILKGAKPADLPFMRSTRFEMVINLKTARALGLTIPPSLLARADEVIAHVRPRS